jgi:hypothetical protein
MAAATAAAAIVLALNLLLVLRIAGVPLPGFAAAGQRSPPRWKMASTFTQILSRLPRRKAVLGLALGLARERS